MTVSDIAPPSPVAGNVLITTFVKVRHGLISLLAPYSNLLVASLN